MAWSYAELKAADALLNIPNTTTAAAALNAQTRVDGPLDISWGAIRDVLMNNLDWGTLVQTCQAAVGQTLPGGGTQTATIQAAAIAIRECCIYGVSLLSSNATVWARITAAGGLLAGGTVGAITVASANAVGALRSPTVPVWSPPVTGNDVAGARLL